MDHTQFQADSRHATLSVHVKAQGTSDLSAWIVRPARLTPGARPLVAIHGISRGAEEQAEAFAQMAAETGRPVIAPLFDETNWQTYQRITNRHRGDRALLRLLTDLQPATGIETDRFDLFGYSGGAQFAHRFAMLYPQRIGALHVAAAGWYCMPNANAAYPFGLADRADRRRDWGSRMMAGLSTFLRLPIRLYIGAEDTIRDEAVRTGEPVDTLQGATRFDRIERYRSALLSAAQTRGIDPDVTLTVLPGCGHSFADCVRLGALDRHVLT